MIEAASVFFIITVSCVLALSLIIILLLISKDKELEADKRNDNI
jgi:hypothetical protein